MHQNKSGRNEFISYCKKTSQIFRSKLKKNRTNEAKFLKRTVAGIGKRSEQHCDSNDVEDLEDGNKLIAREIIKCNLDAMILVAVKSMLKLLQNENIQLRSDATHGITCNRWLLHVCGAIDKHYHFHATVHTFTSSETTATRAFLLENILQSHKSIFGVLMRLFAWVGTIWVGR